MISGGSTSEVRVFLGGPAGAGKTELCRYMYRQGWYTLDMDNKETNKVLEVLDAPADHPLFLKTPLAAEGGFLEKAPLFQQMIDRVGFITFWLTGPKHQLIKSRLQRGAYWDDPKDILRKDWLGLIENYRMLVRWDYEIQMWHEDGKRKSFQEVLGEIETHLINDGHV